MINLLKNNIEGDFIEAGVWRGGATIFMKGILNAYKSNKKIFVADSFEGLPKPDIEKYPEDKGDEEYKWDYLQVPLEKVKANFNRFGLLDDNVIFLKGWFKDSLKSDEIGKLSLVRLDGDMYESTWDSLVALYPKLGKGGFFIIDDYYFNKHKLKNWEFVQIDWAGAYIQK